MGLSLQTLENIFVQMEVNSDIRYHIPNCTLCQCHDRSKSNEWKVVLEKAKEQAKESVESKKEESMSD